MWPPNAHPLLSLPSLGPQLQPAAGMGLGIGAPSGLPPASAALSGQPGAVLASSSSVGPPAPPPAGLPGAASTLPPELLQLVLSNQGQAAQQALEVLGPASREEARCGGQASPPPSASQGNQSTMYASRHQAAEQRRRTRINERLDALRTLVPHAERANTANFLEEVIKYIIRLKDRNDQLEGAIDILRACSKAGGQGGTSGRPQEQQQQANPPKQGPASSAGQHPQPHQQHQHHPSHPQRPTPQPHQQQQQQQQQQQHQQQQQQQQQQQAPPQRPTPQPSPPQQQQQLQLPQHALLGGLPPELLMGLAGLPAGHPHHQLLLLQLHQQHQQQQLQQLQQHQASSQPLTGILPQVGGQPLLQPNGAPLGDLAGTSASKDQGFAPLAPLSAPALSAGTLPLDLPPQLGQPLLHASQPLPLDLHQQLQAQQLQLLLPQGVLLAPPAAPGGPLASASHADLAHLQHLQVQMLAGQGNGLLQGSSSLVMQPDRQQQSGSGGGAAHTESGAAGGPGSEVRSPLTQQQMQPPQQQKQQQQAGRGDSGGEREGAGTSLEGGRSGSQSGPASSEESRGVPPKKRRHAPQQ